MLRLKRTTAYSKHIDILVSRTTARFRAQFWVSILVFAAGCPRLRTGGGGSESEQNDSGVGPALPGLLASPPRDAEGPDP